MPPPSNGMCVGGKVPLPDNGMCVGGKVPLPDNGMCVGGKVPLPDNGMCVVTSFLLLIPLGSSAPPAPRFRSA